MSPSSTVSGFSVHDKIQEVCSHLSVMPLRGETQQNNMAHSECSVREELEGSYLVIYEGGLTCKCSVPDGLIFIKEQTSV